MKNQTLFDIQARLCSSMGSPVRLEILHNLRDGPKCVGELAQLLKRSQPTISRHLAVLRSIGVVMADHQKQNIYYRVTNPKLLDVCDSLREILEEQGVHENRLAREL